MFLLVVGATSSCIEIETPTKCGEEFLLCGPSIIAPANMLNNIQRPKKWLVRGLVKFVNAVAILVCLNLLG